MFQQILPEWTAIKERRATLGRATDPTLNNPNGLFGRLNDYGDSGTGRWSQLRYNVIPRGGTFECPPKILAVP